MLDFCGGDLVSCWQWMSSLSIGEIAFIFLGITTILFIGLRIFYYFVRNVD